MTIKWQPEYIPFADDQVPEISDLNVMEGSRNRGVATRLIQECEARILAKGHSVCGIGVGMTKDYGAAQRLYVKLGYIPDGNGLTHKCSQVKYGRAAMVDDDLVLWFKKSLRSVGQEWTRGQYVVSTDARRLDRKAIHQFLSTKAYWSIDIPSTVVDCAIDNSLCFGLFSSGDNGMQIGFARVITDQATFAWICDVYVENEYRRQGLARWLMECLMSHSSLKNRRRVCLATKDAHALYGKFGFSVTKTPDYWMEIKDNEFYKRLSTLASQGRETP